MQTIRAVLFDLDGTLLENNVPIFFDSYFRRLAGWVDQLIPPEAFLQHLNAATSAMLKNDGTRTNETVFAETFYPLIGRPRAEMEPLFMDFYAREFPKLREYTIRRPEAQRVVARAVELGLDVVVATNPLFPDTAIRQRLEWSGAADFPYRLITTYENSRACKPNLTYFRQIADYLGCQPEECLMVGDEDWDMNAGTLGCLTYLVPGVNTRKRLPDAPEPVYQGTLEELEAVLERHAR
ncbi:MAG: HAD family hydrolase [Armatimonadota bacterium]